jgi:hypothetical protein
MEEKKGICWRSFGIGAGAGIGAAILFGAGKKLVARLKAGKEAEKKEEKKETPEKKD